MILITFPFIMFPNSEINGLDRFLPLVIFTIVGADIALAALAYRYDIAATVRARSIVEPWTISIAAFLFSYYSLRDGLILSYVVSMLAALVASLWPLFKSYGLPWGWRPEPVKIAKIARRNMPLAAADAAEWGSRRLDLAILGLFASPAIVGVYYIAQQGASLPQKLKTSFDPILGPVITRNLADGNMKAIASQVSQVGYWIIAAQIGIALALAIPGEAVMGLVGPNFVGGTGALAFLLAAEAVAATAVVSESALVYIARHRNLLISLSMLLLRDRRGQRGRLSCHPIARMGGTDRRHTDDTRQLCLGHLEMGFRSGRPDIVQNEKLISRAGLSPVPSDRLPAGHRSGK